MDQHMAIRSNDRSLDAHKGPRARPCTLIRGLERYYMRRVCIVRVLYTREAKEQKGKKRKTIERINQTSWRTNRGSPGKDCPTPSVSSNVAPLSRTIMLSG